MRALVIYDSQFGNTEKIAKAIGRELDAPVLPVTDTSPYVLSEDEVDLLVIGSPTQGGHPTSAIQDFVNYIDDDVLRRMDVAVFDTRFGAKIAKIFGFAANRLGDTIDRKGGNLVMPPEGFIVTGKEGPLRVGELNRAIEWAKAIVEETVPVA